MRKQIINMETTRKTSNRKFQSISGLWKERLEILMMKKMLPKAIFNSGTPHSQLQATVYRSVKLCTYDEN